MEVLCIAFGILCRADGNLRQNRGERHQFRPGYGHTHIAEYHEEEGVLVINPGCMQRFSPSISYCYLVLAGKKAVPTIVEIGH